jgi:endo-1,4-beta-xylanase
MRRGLVYGSSTATWQISDARYRALFARQAAIMFTEDDLLWYRLRPKPGDDLDFSYGDRMIGFAEDNGMLVFGAHLAWDQGFGNGWSDADLYGMQQTQARDLLLGTIRRVVGRYRGRVAAWSVANEVFDTGGLRTDVPWYSTVGPSYVADAFRTAHRADPDAMLVLNDFGFETDDGDVLASYKRAAALKVLDALLKDGVPVHALGLQAHLNTANFNTFDAAAYTTWMNHVSDRGVKLLITELDVLDDGQPPQVGPRDRAVADVYRGYLATALQHPAVAALMTFGLSDRYTWLQEDYPRNDKAPRRPLPYDSRLKPTPAYHVLHTALDKAAARTPAWTPKRCTA